MADCNNIQLNNPSPASFSAQEMLSYLDQNGIIDMALNSVHNYERRGL